MESTEAAQRLLDSLHKPDGTILSRAEADGSNYHVVGADRTKQILADLIVALLDQADVAPDSQIAYCLGMAGLGRESDQAVINNICDGIGLDRRRILTHDAEIALVGGLGKLEGVILISGTGAIAYGQTADGRSARSNGWGHLLGDEGSGYFNWVASTSSSCTCRRWENPAN